jgi:phosphatidylinositol glycan class B
LAFAFLFTEKQFKKNGLIAGFLLGLSFLSRFQMVFAIAPLWFWFVFYKREKSFLITSALGIILAIILGGAIDYWGYGNFCFPLWEYFKANILGGAMQATGNAYPPYWYLRWAFLRGIPPVSLFFILGMLFVWIKKIRHPLTWMTLPFFIFHSLISHKEMRFIFFICIMSPIALGLLLEAYEVHFKKYKKAYGALAVMNLSLLFYVSLRPSNPAINFYSFISQHPEISSISVFDENPYTMLGLKLNFYQNDVPNLVMNVEANPDFSKLTNGYYFFTKGEWMAQANALPNCKLIYSAYPAWVLNYNYFNWIKKSRFWSLFNCS